MTIIQWNFVHGRRSIRAGTRLRTVLAGSDVDVDMRASLAEILR
jgi:ribulose kinase